MEKYSESVRILTSLIPYTVLHVIKIVLLVKILNLLKHFKNQWNLWHKKETESFNSVPFPLLI